MKVTIHIWDLPHRLFHWLLAVSVVAAYITAKIGGELIDWHGRLGIFILGLLVFRIIRDSESCIIHIKLCTCAKSPRQKSVSYQTQKGA